MVRFVSIRLVLLAVLINGAIMLTPVPHAVRVASEVTALCLFGLTIAWLVSDWRHER